MRSHLRTLCTITILWPVSTTLAQDATNPVEETNPQVSTETTSAGKATPPATSATSTNPEIPSTAANPENPGADASNELASVPLDFAMFESRGQQVFDIAMNASSENGDSSLSFKSTLVMETEVTAEHVILRDHWEIMGREYDLTFRCEKSPLMPLIDGTIEMSRDGKSQTADLIVENGILKMVAGEQTARFDFPTGTLMQAAIFRIVTQLPQISGQQFTFAGCTEPLEMRVMTPEVGEQFNITCTGSETITVNDESVKCTKFTLNVDKPLQLFVDASSKLRKIVADNGSTVMVMRDGVMAASETP